MVQREKIDGTFYVRHNTVGIPPEYFSHVLLQNLMSLEKNFISRERQGIAGDQGHLV